MNVAKGYWIARVDVTNPEAYAGYVQANASAFAEFGARFLVRAGRFVAPEGVSRSRQIVIEFPDYAAALACYESAAYRRAMTWREGAGEIELVIVEGYDGPQPA